jgi:hypothetical protein
MNHTFISGKVTGTQVCYVITHVYCFLIYKLLCSIIIIIIIILIISFMRVTKPSWCTIYLHFIESLHLYKFQAC